MTKTKLQNKTDSAIVLNESQAGILQKLGEVEPKGTYEVRSQLNQTYKEYLCVSENSNQFTLSTDDLSEWKEISILEPTDGTSGKLFWKGDVTRQQKTGHGKSSSGSPPPSSFLSKVRNKVVGWFPKLKQPAPPATGTVASTTPPATTTTPPATTTGTDASRTPITTDIDASAAPPGATTTSTTTSGVTSTTIMACVEIISS